MKKTYRKIGSLILAALMVFIMLAWSSDNALALKETAAVQDRIELIQATESKNSRFYGEAVNAVANFHIGLEDRTQRESWLKQWQGVKPEAIQNDQDLDREITRMLSSLGYRHDHYIPPNRSASATDNREFTRMKEPDNNVTSFVRVQDDIAYVRLRSFMPHNTITMLEDCLKRASRARVLVLDLRDNSGGYTDYAMESLEMLSKEAYAGLFESRLGDITGTSNLLLDESGWNAIVSAGDLHSTKALVKTQRKHLPILREDSRILILVNRGTASSAEMLAGMLRRTDRALILGERTYGKGVGQLEYPLDNGGILLITNMRFYPGGYFIDGNGLEPDIAATPGTSSDEFRELWLNTAREMAKGKVHQLQNNGV